MTDEVRERNTQRVHNRELLTNAFGEWPSFHDAEVLRIGLDRTSVQLTADIYLFRMTNAVDATGYYVLDNQVIVTLVFSDVVELSLADFNHQNVLWGLEIVDVCADQNEGVDFNVHFSTSYGVTAEFKCSSIEVKAITPYKPPERAAQSAPRRNPPSSA